MKRALPFLGLLLAFSAASCGPSDFDPETLVESVRVLASSADEPYAKPGDTVNVHVLAYDGRPVKPAPMKLYWLPFACENPVGDAYYGCFASIANGGSSDAGITQQGTDGGIPGGGGGGFSIPPGTDITDFLPTGPSFAVKVPDDAVSSHPAVQGASAPYGLVIVFNMACAGRIKTLQINPGQPESVPIGCFDDNGNQLTPDDYVLGYTRVYAYEPDAGTGVVNTNPVISDVKVNGQIIDPHVGFTVSTFGQTADVDVDVPPESQEVTLDKDSNGAPLKESIYASYFVSIGRLDDQVRIIYDSFRGAVDDHHTTFHGGLVPEDGFMWIVVHDNRDGAAWVQIPIHVK